MSNNAAFNRVDAHEDAPTVTSTGGLFTREQAMKIALAQELRGMDRETTVVHIEPFTFKPDAPEDVAKRIGHTKLGPYTSDQLTRLYNLLAVAEVETLRLRNGNRALLGQIAAAQKWYRSEWHVEDGHDVVYPWDHT